MRDLASPLLSICLALLLLASHSQATSYVGTEQCAGCHEQELAQWQGSHHDWAMKVATPETVLGDFNDATFTHQGVRSTFTRKGSAFYINTQGANGEYQNFKIDYTFGVEPLQQYLIKFDDGRMQALTIAWDSRPKEQGGQRWYQLMPNDLGLPGESLHWTGAYYNWNTRCAECHSTGLEKNYSMDTDTFATAWSEVNVACESCHGPGAEHADWARSGSKGDDNGLQVQYSEQLNWVIAKGTSIANPQGDPHQGATTEIESCAACHSRRSKISSSPINNYSEDKTFLDHYQLQTLEQGLYHADGQIRDEVYVYGSFLQSKMHQRGVSCSNCHNPHSLELKAEGNALCVGCHAPETYNTPKHHHHQQADSTGAQCVNCHMPATVYMGVDTRRDHSMRVPRPDIAAQIDAPNACNMCHTDQQTSWSISAIESWLGKQTSSPDPAALAIYAGRANAPDANQQLIDLANNATVNNMARATALGLLHNHPNMASYGAAQQQLKSDKPLLRIGALNALSFLPLQQRWQDISPLLRDPVRSVRLEATRLLMGIGGLDAFQQAGLDKNIARYIEALMANADMPNGQLNLAAVYMAQGSYQQAEQAYQHALRLDSKSVPARLNLADLYRVQGREQRALEQLLQAQAADSNNATVLHSLGLAQIRGKQNAAALKSLAQAAALASEISHYSYVYGIALNGQGRGREAVEVMIRALANDQQNRNLLFALATISRDLGQRAEARDFAQQLVLAFPQDSAALQLRDSLK
ncbi:MAG: multiheme c-type cytochrome [Porticoccaceae bacterium]|nr:multiheme c-type cytochrome [Porticoccaceae bacterium]